MDKKSEVFMELAFETASEALANQEVPVGCVFVLDGEVVASALESFVFHVQRSQNMHLVFVYGTLKRGEPNDHFWTNPGLGTVKFIAKAKTVRKFPLTIASEYNLPYLLFKPGFGSRIVGEIYEVQNLWPLDEFEGYPGYYSRLEEEVELEDGRMMRTWLYTLENFKRELLERALLSEYSSTNLDGLAFKRGAGENPQHIAQVKNCD